MRRIGLQGRWAIGVLALALCVGGPAAWAAGWGRSHRHWVATWGASPVVGSQDPYSPGCPAGNGLANQTVRTVVLVRAVGARVRVRLASACGDEPSDVGHATVARQG